MIVMFFLFGLIILWLLYRFKLANRIMKEWLENNNLILIEKKYYLFYNSEIIKKFRFYSCRQILYEIDVQTKDSKRKTGVIIIGNWFWGLLEKEVNVVWDDYE